MWGTSYTSRRHVSHIWWSMRHIWVIPVLHVTHSFVSRDSFICARCHLSSRVIHTNESQVVWHMRYVPHMSHSCSLHDSFICFTWLVHMCQMPPIESRLHGVMLFHVTRSYVPDATYKVMCVWCRHDSICDADMTQYVVQTWLINSRIHLFMYADMYVDSGTRERICGNETILMCVWCRHDSICGVYTHDDQL